MMIHEERFGITSGSLSFLPRPPSARRQQRKRVCPPADEEEVKAALPSFATLRKRRACSLSLRDTSKDPSKDPSKVGHKDPSQDTSKDTSKVSHNDSLRSRDTGKP